MSANGQQTEAVIFGAEGMVTVGTGAVPPLGAGPANPSSAGRRLEVQPA
jgi:hypothetical protein